MNNQQFAPQTMLLNVSDKARFLFQVPYEDYFVPEDFYEKGYSIINAVADITNAQTQVEKFISNIDTQRLPLHERFRQRVQLAKIDEIPVCADVVDSSYQVLHLDMGQPIISKVPQDIYLFTALYRERDKPQTTAKTRLMSLRSFFKEEKWGTKKHIEERLIEYAQKYGDGWLNPSPFNTQRIACFARILDAVAGTTELAKYIDKTVGQWYENEEKLSADENLEKEYAFFSKHGIDLSLLEEFVQLKPGEVVI
ncbi:MAG TPA: hypothetical protein VNW29_06255, partial [Candidatus Sulfotelmatobacter sp.]|nr:hypothetical protein [Candidatus Sulfotelmatobacter sp.]